MLAPLRVSYNLITIMFPESSAPPLPYPQTPDTAIPAIPIRHTVPSSALIPREPPHRALLCASAIVLQCRK